MKTIIIFLSPIASGLLLFIFPLHQDGLVLYEMGSVGLIFAIGLLIYIKLYTTLQISVKNALILVVMSVIGSLVATIISAPGVILPAGLIALLPFLGGVSGVVVVVVGLEQIIKIPRTKRLAFVSGCIPLVFFLIFNRKLWRELLEIIITKLGNIESDNKSKNLGCAPTSLANASFRHLRLTTSRLH